MLMLPDYRVRQREFLLEISRAMTAQLDLGEVLRLVLNASVIMLGAQVGLIALCDANGVYTIRKMLGVNPEQYTKLNQQFYDMVRGSNGDLKPEYLDAKLRQMAMSLDRKLHQSLFLPLVIGGEPVGLLIVFRAYWVDATENDIQILQSFADQAAVAVHNAQLYARIDQERKRLSAILEYSADGIMILDAGSRILGFNRALERMTGWSASEAVGKRQNEVISWQHLDKGSLEDALAQGWPFRLPPGAPLETLYVEGDLLRKDGLTVGIAITYAPLLTPDAQLSNIIANVRDVTNYRKAQELQNTFISTVSHELRTPVALIKGYAGTLRREDAAWDPEIIKNGLTVIEEESDRLTGLIENLLSASKLKAERMQLTLTDVELDKLSAQVVERFKTQTQVHTLKLNFPKHFPAVQGDEVRLRQVLDNLVSNAIKYSPKGGTIEVGGDFDDDSVTVYVRDQGVGLTETEQERIFDRFYRVDSALSRKTQGTGLGLYLAKAIIDAHNGSIGVTSKPKAGSTFYFIIPREN